MNQLFSKTSTFAMVICIVGTFTLFAQPVSAATIKPTCSLSVTHDGITTQTKLKEEITVLKNTPVTIVWASKNATKAVDSDKNVVATSGTSTVTPEVKSKYEYTFSQGSKKVTCSVEVSIISGTITTKTVVKNGEKINLTGKVLGVKKVAVLLFADGTTTPTYTTKSLSVKNKKYSFKMPKALPDGNYRIVLQTTGASPVVLATSTIAVGKVAPVAHTALVVKTIPLLAGGMAKVGSGVAVAYIQVINVGNKPANLTGFTFAQNGTAPVSVISGLSITDEAGLARGSVGNMISGLPFTTSSITIPVITTLAAKESRLFTVRAVVGPTATMNIGQTMVLTLQGITGDAKVQSALPLSGVTWTIVQ